MSKITQCAHDVLRAYETRIIIRRRIRTGGRL